LKTQDDQPKRVLEVEALSKRYGERLAVREVSFSIRAGEIYGLLGPNGAGKTTTIGMVATVIAPTLGEILISGMRPTTQPESVRKQVGLVPQSLGLYPSLTAEENLRFFGRMYGVEEERLGRRVEALLELTGLAGRRNDRVRVYSGGMKRRLNLACGLVHQPKLLLLDEPTVGVDPQSRERIFAAVEELARLGMAVLYTTHYMEEAERLCRRVAIMDEGCFVAEGTIQELAALAGPGTSVMVHFEKSPSDSLLNQLPAGGGRRGGGDRYRWSAEGVEVIVAEVLRLAALEDNSIRELVVHRPNLGEVFLHLTGKDLRD
jgi:ABC-2 type transport system ATP-binding protein